MKSNWELIKKRSQYHFDPKQWDPKWDRVEQLGHIQPCWDQELSQAIEQSRPVNAMTPLPRDKHPESWGGQAARPNMVINDKEQDQEEYDLESYGISKDYVTGKVNYDLAPIFQQIADQFALEDCVARVHVQYPGQVWQLHLDKLEKWLPEDPTQVVRYVIQLTDWQPGHFWSYGNYMWSGWRAGNVTSNDWINIPHSTANAGHVPRATLQITGIKTAETDKFLEQIKQ
jgi:hypothetical protein